MIDLKLDPMKAVSLLRILNNALDNHELFTDVDENNYEKFDNDFNMDIRKIRDTLRYKLKITE